MGVNFLKKNMYQNLVSSKSWEKSQNKVGMTKEICYVNDLVVSKIGPGNEPRH